MDINKGSSTLKLVHVIFRHGDRTPESTFSYPNDPHKNESFHPHGLGQLNNEGKLKSYKLGQYLRTRYHNFLGKVYIPATVDAMSSDSDRTKATLQLVLAGLFPPKGSQVWNEDLLWQPIPYTYTPIENDKMFFGLLPLRYYLEKNLVLKDKVTKQEELLKYLTEHSGMDVTNSVEVFKLDNILTTQEHCKLKLPNWTHKVYPEPLTSIVTEFYQMLLEDEGAKRLATGQMLQKIGKDTSMKLLQSGKKQPTKMHLYSAHDVNIAFLLIALGLFKPHIPPYLAHIIIEVHTIDGINGVKIYYQDYTSAEPQLLKLPNCAEFCPHEEFLKITNNIE